jgi:hypothetical protein
LSATNFPVVAGVPSPSLPLLNPSGKGNDFTNSAPNANEFFPDAFGLYGEFGYPLAKIGGELYLNSDGLQIQWPSSFFMNVGYAVSADNLNIRCIQN